MIPQHTEIILGKITIDDIAELYGDDLIMLDGHDNAIVGVVNRKSVESVICYSIDIIIQNLIGDGDMTEDEAYEFYDYNIADMWAGDKTPCFITFFRAELLNGN